MGVLWRSASPRDDGLPGLEDAYGFTFSDLAQRLLPTIILDAYPAGPIEAAQAIALARSIEPTPPFNNA